MTTSRIRTKVAVCGLIEFMPPNPTWKDKQQNLGGLGICSVDWWATEQQGLRIFCIVLCIHELVHPKMVGTFCLIASCSTPFATFLVLFGITAATVLACSPRYDHPPSV